MQGRHAVFGRIITKVPALLSMTLTIGLVAGPEGRPGNAHAQSIVPTITREVARNTIEPKIRDMWLTMNQTQGLRALLHSDLLPAGTSVKPAFASNSALQEMVCQNACWLFFIDKAPGAHFSHPVSILLLDAETGQEQLLEAEWWPEVTKPGIGKAQLFNTLELRRDPGMIVVEESPALFPVIKSKGGSLARAPRRSALKGLLPESLPAPCDGCEAWAIIVCGYDDLPDTFDEDTDGIYAALRSQGLPDDHIFFLSPHTAHPGVDLPTSKTNVEWAIDQVAGLANADDKVLFFYSSHGGIDGLTCIDTGISAAELDTWLARMAFKELSVVIEACHSGSFIGRYADGTYVPAEDDLTGAGKTGRVVFTSASTDTSSYPDVDGADDPNEADDIGSESIYGYVMALSLAAADANADGAVSFDEGVQYALANDVTRIRGDNAPQSSSTADMTPAKVHHYCYPTSVPGGPYSAECSSATAQALVDGTASSTRPPCDGTLQFLWDTDCPSATYSDPTLASPLLSLSPITRCQDCNVWLKVTCSDGSSDVRSSTLSVTDSLPPTITCPASLTTSCEQPTGPEATGFATAADSCDPAPPISYLDVVTPGACPNAWDIMRTWKAADGCGNEASCTQNIEVTDATPPDIGSALASPSLLWPPNHKMTPVKVTVAVTDNCSSSPVCTISSVSSNEPVNGLGDGDTAPDWFITGPLTLNVRAERSGKGSGRVYSIAVTCTDECGNSSTRPVTVTVPKSKKPVKAEKTKKSRQ